MEDMQVPGRSLFRRDGKKNLKALPRSPGERLARVIYDSGDFTAASILTDSINTRSAQISWELIKNTWMPLFLCQVAPKSEMLYSTCSSELNQFGERKWAPTPHSPKLCQIIRVIGPESDGGSRISCTKAL